MLNDLNLIKAEGLGAFELIGSQVNLLFKKAEYVESKEKHYEIFEYLLESKLIKMYCECSDERITPEVLARTYYKILIKKNLI